VANSGAIQSFNIALYRQTVKLSGHVNVGYRPGLSVRQATGRGQYLGLPGRSSCIHTKTGSVQSSCTSSWVNASVRQFANWATRPRMLLRGGTANTSDDANFRSATYGRQTIRRCRKRRRLSTTSTMDAALPQLRGRWAIQAGSYFETGFGNCIPSSVSASLGMLVLIHDLQS